jgi:tRNA(fMet)-specific endonuclease VapC
VAGLRPRNVTDRNGFAEAQRGRARRIAEYRVGIELADTAAHAADRARALAAITSVVDVLDYTETTAVQLARLNAHARQTGSPRGSHDLVIAAHAAQTGRTILSYDAKARLAHLPGVLAVEP